MRKNNTSYVEAKTKNQKEYILSIINNIITICIGQAGVGKSYIPLGLAIEHIERNDRPQKQLIITRPLISVGTDIGSLPGTIDERIFPYFRPAYFNLLKIIGSENKLKKMILDRTIMFEPLELMRGMTYDDSYIVVDEAQDTTAEQMLMVLTRIGENSKIIINGDLDQTDIKGINGLYKCLDVFSNVDYAQIIEMTENDQQRNSIINRICNDFRKVK